MNQGLGWWVPRVEEGLAFAGPTLGLLAVLVVFGVDLVRRPRSAWLGLIPVGLAAAPVLLLVFGFDGDLDFWSRRLFDRGDQLQVAWLLGERSVFVYRNLGVVAWATALGLVFTRWLRPHEDDAEVEIHHPQWWAVGLTLVAAGVLAVVRLKLALLMSPVFTAFLLAVALGRRGVRADEARPVIAGLLALSVVCAGATVMAVPATSPVDPLPSWVAPSLGLCVVLVAGFGLALGGGLRPLAWGVLVLPLGARWAALPPIPELPVVSDQFMSSSYQAPPECVSRCSPDDVPCPPVGRAARVKRRRWGWAVPWYSLAGSLPCGQALAPGLTLDAVPEQHREILVQGGAVRTIGDGVVISGLWKVVHLRVLRTENGMIASWMGVQGPARRMSVEQLRREVFDPLYDEFRFEHYELVLQADPEVQWTVQEALTLCDEAKRALMGCVWESLNGVHAEER